MRCKAKRSDGNPCGAWAVKGATVCNKHGGSAPQVRGAAKRRLAEQKATQAVRTLGLPKDITPTEALLSEVRWTAGHVEWLRERVQELDTATGTSELTWGTTRVTDKPLTGPEETRESKPSIWYQLYAQERDRLVAVSSAALKAGVEERRVRVAEQQGDMLAAVLRTALDAIHQRLTHAGMPPTLTPAWTEAVSVEVPAAIRQIATRETP